MRLPRLGRLGAEAVDEGLHVLALRILLLDHLLVEQQPLAPLPLELRIAAAIERELARLQRQNVPDRVVEQVAVVADDDHGLRIAGEVVLQPQRAFEVEIVGRLVEQQQIGLGKQRRGQRDAHAPAAGEFRAGALLVGGGKAEAGKDRGRARRRRMRADVGKPRLDLGDAVRVVRDFRLGQKRRALAVGLEHDLEQAFRAARRFLRQPADAPARRHLDVAMLG